MPSTRSGASYSPSSSSQKGNSCDYGRRQPVTEGKGSVDDFQTTKMGHSEADNTILPSKRSETATTSLSGRIQSQPQSLQQCTAIQGVPDPGRSLDKLHELLPDCEKVPGPYQYLQIAQWMASIDGKEKHDALDTRMEEKQPSTTQTSFKNSLSGQQQQFQREKAATSSKQGQRRGTSPKALQPRIQDYKDSEGCHGKCISDGQNQDGITEEGGSKIKIPEMISDIFDSIPELYEAINDVKKHLSDKNETICNNIKTNSSSLCQINETLMCFEKSTIIKELTDKYSKFNIDDIIEKRVKQAIIIVKTDNEKVLDDISNSFTEVKMYTISLKKCFDASQEEVSKLSMKLNQVTADNTRQTELWQELTHKEDMYKIEVMNLIQAFQHEYRNSQRCSNSKMNDIEQILNNIPRTSTPLNQYEGTRIPNPQVLDPDNPQLKNELSTSSHNLEPSMGQALLKEVPKLKE
ncbi:hypothetical protein O181_070866 [Austropuccinia psidii MF-1]|uniref:Uncharacterized protein n=1 Tax=Austropuccinia psidii MF-1 TaxID=1389203 RepID=A0A9Q3EZN3_9BASI|nr:hypothetical protein [Austropuccinia psidii MF-1]